MVKFPEQIPVPPSVYQLRMDRKKQILSTVLRGVYLRCIIIGAEVWGFWYWGSFSLFADALATLLDIAASLLLMLCVKLADKPPDTHHPLGHGRFEPVAGLQLGIFLVVIGVYLGVHQITAAAKETSLQVISPYAWVIPLLAMMLLEMGYQRLKAVAQKQNSPALLADAVHYRIDALSCLLATVALISGAYLPRYSHLLDHLGAFFIALLLVAIGIKAFWENLHQVLDRAPSADYFKMVHEAAMRVPGVLATEKLRIQAYGPDAQVCIDIEVDPLLTVETAHAITQNVRLEIQKTWPAVRDVIVHVEPYYENDHKTFEWQRQ